MEKILSQHAWDRLPVNTYARLTRFINGVEHFVFATRITEDVMRKEGNYFFLGPAAWREMFNDCDVAHTLYVPAGRSIDVSELTAVLRKFVPTAVIQVAGGHRRFRPGNFGATAAGELLLLGTAVEETYNELTVKEFTDRLDRTMGLPLGSGASISQGTLIAVEADRHIWRVTGVRQEGESAVIVTDLVTEDPDLAEPKWTTTTEYAARANKVARIFNESRPYTDSTPDQKILRDLLGVEAGLAPKEASLAAARTHLRMAEETVDHRKKDLALARYLAGVTESLDAPVEEEL